MQLLFLWRVAQHNHHNNHIIQFQVVTIGSSITPTVTQRSALTDYIHSSTVLKMVLLNTVTSMPSYPLYIVTVLHLPGRSLIVSAKNLFIKCF